MDYEKFKKIVSEKVYLSFKERVVVDIIHNPKFFSELRQEDLQFKKYITNAAKTLFENAVCDIAGDMIGSKVDFHGTYTVDGKVIFTLIDDSKVLSEHKIKYLSPRSHSFVWFISDDFRTNETSFKGKAIYGEEIFEKFPSLKNNGEFQNLKKYLAKFQGEMHVDLDSIFSNKSNELVGISHYDWKELATIYPLVRPLLTSFVSEETLLKQMAE